MRYWHSGLGAALLCLASCNYSEQKTQKTVPTASEASLKAPPASDMVWLEEKLFQAKCGQCHNSARPAGGFNLQDPGSLKASMGRGIVAGNHGASRLSQAIMSGRMPPPGRGTQPSEKEVSILNCWIDRGAADSENSCWKKFGQTTTGDAEQKAPPETPPAEPTEPPPTDETPIPDTEVSYRALESRVLIPICVGCHNKDDAASNIRVDGLVPILNPVAGPALVKCGKPSESLLYTAIETDYMPYGADPLPAELKKLVFDWIEKECP